MAVQLFAIKNISGRSSYYYLLPVEPKEKKALADGNLGSSNSSAHLPLIILKLNRQDHDCNQEIFSAESCEDLVQTGPGGVSLLMNIFLARRC